MKILQNKIDITNYVTSVTWSGSAEQASRSLSYSTASNQYDKKFNAPMSALGDIVTFYDKTRLYVGVVTGREKKNEVGDIPVKSKDYLHYLLRDNISYAFKNRTAEWITSKICKDLGFPTGKIAKTGMHIAKLIIDRESAYNAVVKAYNKAGRKSKKHYMPVMSGAKVSIVEKWKSCGVTLEYEIIDADYSENSDSVVNQVVIYNEKGKRIGVVKDQQSKDRFGLYQDGYIKEKGVNSKEAAKQMFKSLTKEASLECLGNSKCIAGTTIKIKNKATGLTGEYYITSDTHTWANGQHTMQLDICFKKERESV